MQDISIPSAGHHDKDPGAVANGYREADVTKLIRNSVICHLEELDAEYKTDADLETNTQYQNRIRNIKGKVVLDIHLNAASPTAKGTEVIVSKNASHLSKQFADEILNSTCSVLGTVNRGVKDETKTARGSIGIVNLSGLACLVEVCFISNKEEMAILMSPGMIDKLGKAYAHIMVKYDKLYNM